MSFTKPEFPPVDPDTFLTKPLMERMRFLAQHWTDNGFGSPRMVHAIYIAKLVFFYALGVLMTAVGFLLGLLVTILRVGWGNDITTPTIVLVALLFIAGLQLTLFAMWFDMEANKDLR